MKRLRFESNDWYIAASFNKMTIDDYIRHHINNYLPKGFYVIDKSIKFDGRSLECLIKTKNPRQNVRG